MAEHIVIVIKVMIFSVLCSRVKSDECVTTSNGPLPYFDNVTEPACGCPIIRGSHQAIIESYQFQCYSCITGWEIGLGQQTNNSVYNVHFQVWSPSQTMEDDGCYELVGEDVISSVETTDGLICLTVTDDMIHTHPGDVVGYYVESVTQPNDFGVGLNTSFDTESVWYDDTGNLDIDLLQPCPVPVERVLTRSTNAAPFIHVSVSCQDEISTSYITFPMSTTLASYPGSISTEATTTPALTSSHTSSIPKTSLFVSATPTHTTENSPTKMSNTNDTDNGNRPSNSQQTGHGLIIGVTVSLLIVASILVLLVATTACVVARKKKMKGVEMSIRNIISTLDNSNTLRIPAESNEAYVVIKARSTLNKDVSIEAYEYANEDIPTGSNTAYITNTHTSSVALAGCEEDMYDYVKMRGD